MSFIRKQYSEFSSDSNRNGIKRKFRRFSVKTYRQILRAWMTPTDTSADDFDYKSQTNDGLQSVDTTDQTSKEVNKTTDLNDSLDSIPETKEFVDKSRKFTERKIKTKVNKRLVSKFIHFEADVDMDSNESFCDDIEDTQQELENSSQTIVEEILPPDTQPIGQLIGGIDSRSAEDMQSVYLRSVKEIENRDKYKLQYNYDPNIDVFSQEPNESDLEDYEFDSFCVPNDSIEMDESSPQSTTSFQVSMESPAIKTRSKGRKKFKRIVFSP